MVAILEEVGDGYEQREPQSESGGLAKLDRQTCNLHVEFWALKLFRSGNMRCFHVFRPLRSSKDQTSVLSFIQQKVGSYLPQNSSHKTLLATKLSHLAAALATMFVHVPLY